MTFVNPPPFDVACSPSFPLFCISTLLRTLFVVPEPIVLMKTPLAPLSETSVFDRKNLLGVEEVVSKSMPCVVKFRIVLSRTVKLLPELNWMPVVVPVMPTPLSDTPCMKTLPVTALMVIAGELAAGAA